MRHKHRLTHFTHFSRLCIACCCDYWTKGWIDIQTLIGWGLHHPFLFKPLWHSWWSARIRWATSPRAWVRHPIQWAFRLEPADFDRDPSKQNTWIYVKRTFNWCQDNFQPCSVWLPLTQDALQWLLHSCTACQRPSAGQRGLCWAQVLWHFTAEAHIWGASVSTASSWTGHQDQDHLEWSHVHSVDGDFQWVMYQKWGPLRMYMSYSKYRAPYGHGHFPQASAVQWKYPMRQKKRFSCVSDCVY